MGTRQQQYDDPFGGPGFDGEVSPRGRLVDGAATPSERTHAMWIHLGTLIAWALSAGLLVPPIVSIILWQMRKDSPFVDDHGREGVNFQLSLILYGVLTIPLAILTCGVGAIMFAVIWVLGLLGMIMGALAAHRGEYFRYPACVRFISPRG